MLTALEIKAAAAAVATSVLFLGVTFKAGALYRERHRLGQGAGEPSASAAVTAQGRGFFFQSCAHCHGQDADGGEDAPSLHKLPISGAHMALLIQSGIKDEMPAFSKKYNEQDTAAVVAYLKTLH